MGHGWGLDDAYISYRYAGNFVSGHGLVFNPGERVQQYSNFLYVLLIAPAFFLTGGQTISWVSVGLKLLLALETLVAVQRFLKRRHGEQLGAVVLSLSPPLRVAVASGMETPLVLLVQVGVWIAVTTLAESPGWCRAVGLGLLLVVSLLAHTDGFLIGMIAIVYLLLNRRTRAALQAGCLLAARVLGRGDLDPLLGGGGGKRLWGLRREHHGHTNHGQNECDPRSDSHEIPRQAGGAYDGAGRPPVPPET